MLLSQTRTASLTQLTYLEAYWKSDVWERNILVYCTDM